MNEELTRFVRARIDEDDADVRNVTEPGAVRLGRQVEANRALLDAYEAAAAAADEPISEMIEQEPGVLPDAILTPDGTPAFTKAGMLKTIELASSPAYRVAAALELAVAQRAAVWRDHPDYRDWADEDQATPGA